MRKPLCIIAAAMFLSSCASIVSHSSSTFGVDTTPQGANVEIIDRKGQTVYRGQTPVTTRLKHNSGFFKKASYQIKFSMAGYEPKLVTVDAHVNGWYWGNFLIGGILGFLIIDPATGAMYKLDTIMVDEKLAPSNATGSVSFDGLGLTAVDAPGSKSGEGPQSLKVMTLNDVPAEWRSKLVKLQ